MSDQVDRVYDDSVWHLTREHFLFPTHQEDLVIKVRKETNRTRPEFSSVQASATFFQVARVLAFMVLVGTVIGYWLCLVRYGVSGFAVITIGAFVLLDLLSRWARGCFRKSLGYALERSKGREQGWLMCRWIWISYQLIRDWFWLLSPSMTPFFPWGEEDSIGELLGTLRDAAHYAHLKAETDAQGREWSFTADARFDTLIEFVIKRSNISKDVEGNAYSGLLQRLMWWIDKPLVFLGYLVPFAGVLVIICWGVNNAKW